MSNPRRNSVLQRLFRGSHRSLISLSVCVLCLCAGIAHAAQNVEVETLPNGMTLLLQRHRLSNAIECRVVVKAGPAYEGELAGTGVSELVRQLLLSGDKLPTVGRLRSWTDTVGTTYAISGVGKQLGEFLPALANLVTAHRFNEESFKKGRETLLARQARQLTDPVAFERSHIDWLVYRQHPARFPIVGRAADTRELTQVQLQRYFNRRYTSNNMVVTVIGNLDDLQAVRSMVEEAFAKKVRSGTWSATLAPDEPAQAARRSTAIGAAPLNREITVWQTQQMTTGLRKQGKDGTRPVVALEVLAALLQDPVHSPLRKALVATGLVSDLRVEHRLGQVQAGYFAISYEPVADKGPQAWSQLDEVLGKLKENGPEEQALKSAKRRLLMARLHANATVDGISDQVLAWALATNGAASMSQSFHSYIAEVSTADIQHVLSTWVRPHFNNHSRLRLHTEAAAEQGDGVANSSFSDPIPKEKKLSGGVTLLTRLFEPQYGRVHLNVTIAGGYAAEKDENRGVTAILAKLLAEGSQDLAGTAWRESLAADGMEYRVVPGMHSLQIELTCLSGDVDKAIGHLVALIKTPALPKDALQVAVQESVKQLDQRPRLDDWNQHLLREVHRRAFADHYAGAPVMGTKESLAAMDVAMVQDFWKRRTIGSGLVFSIYGGLTLAAMAQAEKTLMEALTAEPGIVEGFKWNPAGVKWMVADAAPRHSLSWDEASSGLAMAWRGPALSDLEQYGPALAVLNACLSGGNGHSRLARAVSAVDGVVLDEQSVVSSSYDQRGLWVVLLRLSGGKTRKGVEDAVVKVLQDFHAGLEKDGAVTDAELEHARELVLTDRVLQDENQAEVAAGYAGAYQSGLFAYRHGFRDAVRQVNREQLRQLLERFHLQFEPCVIELVRPGDANKVETGQVPETGATTERTKEKTGAAP